MYVLPRDPISCAPAISTPELELELQADILIGMPICFVGVAVFTRYWSCSFQYTT